MFKWFFDDVGAISTHLLNASAGTICNVWNMCTKSFLTLGAATCSRLITQLKASNHLRVISAIWTRENCSIQYYTVLYCTARYIYFNKTHILPNNDTHSHYTSFFRSVVPGKVCGASQPSCFLGAEKQHDAFAHRAAYLIANAARNVDALVCVHGAWYRFICISCRVNLPV